MRRIGRDLHDRAAQEEFFRPQAGDDVAYRQLELLDGERARVAQADERATAANELLERLQIRRGKLVRVLRTDRAAAASTTAAASGRARDANSGRQRHARIVGDDQHVDLSAER